MKPGSLQSASKREDKHCVKHRRRRRKLPISLTVFCDLAGRHIVARDDIDAERVGGSGVESSRFANYVHAAFGREMNGQRIVDDGGNLNDNTPH